MDQEQIGVSVICTVYNHEKYLRQCLDGFVMQKTTFPFEVIVHDDASTDHSADIIREYEEKYPQIIKPIYQKENQYSKRVSIGREFLLPKVRGKYVASCEGDDFWTDAYKLQKQYDVMEAHPECHFCVHKVQCVDEAGDLVTRCYPSIEVRNGLLATEEFMGIIGQQYAFQTSSYFRRMEDYRNYLQNPPEFVKVADVGDVPTMLYLGSLGYVYYIHEPMSCYRMNSIGSWTLRQRGDSNRQRMHAMAMVNMYDVFNRETQDRYKEALMPCRRKYNLTQCIFNLQDPQNARILLKKENRDFLNQNNFQCKVYVFLMAYAPWAAKLYYCIKGKRK